MSRNAPPASYPDSDQVTCPSKTENAETQRPIGRKPSLEAPDGRVKIRFRQSADRYHSSTLASRSNRSMKGRRDQVDRVVMPHAPWLAGGGIQYANAGTANAHRSKKNIGQMFIKPLIKSYLFPVMSAVLARPIYAMSNGLSKIPYRSIRASVLYDAMTSSLPTPLMYTKFGAEHFVIDT